MYNYLKKYKTSINTSNLDKPHTEISQDTPHKSPVFPVDHGRQGDSDGIVNIERRIQNHTVFHIDDSSFISSLPRATHWSIAWSDLMMTMFILFLSMFVYQAANEEFLKEKKPEILGGDTTEALKSIDASEAAFPFAPIYPGIPLMTAGTIKKVEQTHADIISSKYDPVADIQKEKTEEKQVITEFKTPDSKLIPEEQIALILPPNDTPTITSKNPVTQQPPEEFLEPAPLDPAYPASSEVSSFQEIFVLSKNILENSNLDKFASIDIIPDKTMRIILTSDLLFALGKSELSYKAKNSLRKIAEIIRRTPYMINVVGHTDNIPMQSYRFKSNWELSVARATTVTRFFIDEIGMDPIQFVVSGYSSYRPIKPNTNAENRAKNRRVEIIISKRLPNPAPLTTKNLQ